MDTSARGAAPESPMWLLDSERKSKARFNRRPLETKTNTLAAMKGTYRENIKLVLGYTCAIYVAPASPIELNARLSDNRFLLADLVVERANPIRRAPSSPIWLFRRDKWVMLYQRNIQHESCILLVNWYMNIYVNNLYFYVRCMTISYSQAVLREEKVVALLWKRVAF